MGRNYGQGALEEGCLVSFKLLPLFCTLTVSRNDPKTVSIAALACGHPNVKVQSAGIHFFLGSENEDEEESSEDEGPDLKKLEHQRIINKKKRADDRRFAKAQATVKKKRKEKEANAAGGTVNFPALELLHDPQSFGEKLYDNLHRHGMSFYLWFLLSFTPC